MNEMNDATLQVCIVLAGLDMCAICEFLIFWLGKCWVIYVFVIL